MRDTDSQSITIIVYLSQLLYAAAAIRGDYLDSITG